VYDYIREREREKSRFVETKIKEMLLTFQLWKTLFINYYDYFLILLKGSPFYIYITYTYIRRINLQYSLQMEEEKK